MDTIHRIHIFRHRIIIFNKESMHRGALRPCRARPKAASLLSLLNIIILCLHIWIKYIIISMLQLFGMIFQIINIIPYLSLLMPFEGAHEIDHMERVWNEFGRIYGIYSTIEPNMIFPQTVLTL